MMLDLVLSHYEGIEGGFWSPGSNFLAYSFPTHESVKRDVPQAESERILTLNRRVLQTGRNEVARFDSASEVLLLNAIRVSPNLVVWTMGRAHVRAASAFEKLTAGFIVLLVLMLSTGGLILWCLHTWERKLSLVEEQLRSFPGDNELPKTGVSEFDRLITAFNRQSDSLQMFQEQSNRLSAKLARAERLAAVGRMSAGLAHEIRNPLGAMRLRVENSLAKSNDESQERTFQLILGEIARLDDLLERLLAIVRLEKLCIKKAALLRLVEDRAYHFRQEGSAARIEVTGPDIEWTIDERQITRALDNLLLNALRETPAQGWARISLMPEGKTCSIIVEDSGPGVLPKNREQIFEPFVSFGSNGAGLGLAIVREIVEAHSGTIVCAESATGARFEIRLPWRES
jgi:signal transduction histidine kinase